MPTASFDRRIIVTASPADVWRAVTDVKRLISWVSVLSDASEHEHLVRYTAVLSDRLGPFRLHADLDVHVSDVDEPHGLSVTAEGEDRQVSSRISVAARLDLQPTADGTEIVASGTYEVTGRVATLGAGTITKKAQRILDDFFSSAERELS